MYNNDIIIDKKIIVRSDDEFEGEIMDEDDGRPQVGKVVFNDNRNLKNSNKFKINSGLFKNG